MPEQKTSKPEHYKDFIKEMEQLDELIKLVNIGSQSDVTPLKEKALSDLEEYVWNSFSEEDKILLGSPDNISQEISQQIIKHDVGRHRENASTNFFQNLDVIVEEMEPKTLEALVASPLVQSRAQGNDTQTVQLYHQYKQFDAFVTRYENTLRTETQTEERILQNAAVTGYAKTQEEKVKGKLEKNFVRALATQVMRIGLSRRTGDAGVADLIKEYAKGGLEEQRKEFKDAYEKLTRDTNRDVYGAVRNVLKGTKEIAQKAPEEFSKVYNTVFAAEKGDIKYQPLRFGEQREE